MRNSKPRDMATGRNARDDITAVVMQAEDLSRPSCEWRSRTAQIALSARSDVVRIGLRRPKPGG